MSNRFSLLMVALTLCLGCEPPAVPGAQTWTPEDGGSDTHNPPVGSTDAGYVDPACAVVTAEAKSTPRPVDIVMIVDNSCSMADEIKAIQDNINVNFSDILTKSSIDYRLILLSRHGDVDDGFRICIQAPLSGNGNCDPIPSEPIAGPRFFHYSTQVESFDSLVIALRDYRRAITVAPNGWGAWLRPDSVKNFIEVTDDNSTQLSAEKFDQQLLALAPEHFGTAAKRNYVFHSIVGLQFNTPLTKPWLPTDPLQTVKCIRPGGTASTGAVNAGLEYQKLSVLTGGLRYPICGYESFSTVFQTVAQSVADTAKVACEFDIPTPPDGRTISYAQIKYAPGDGSAAQTFKQIATSATCSATTFYVDGKRVKLCPDACTTVSKDTRAKLSIDFTCSSAIN